METIDCKQSLNIASARYREAEKILEIDFKNGKGVTSTYEYRSFSSSDWNDFKAAESKGQHFAYKIKMKKDAQGDPAYPSKRIK